jgi:hypothetical protein
MDASTDMNITWLCVLSFKHFYFSFSNTPFLYSYSISLMNTISVLLSSEQWVSTNSTCSTDMVSINIPLCGTASTLSCRSAHISVTTSVCNSRMAARVSVQFYIGVFCKNLSTHLQCGSNGKTIS